MKSDMELGRSSTKALWCVGLAVVMIAPLKSAAVPDIDAPLRTGARAPADAAVVIGNEAYAYVPDVPFARRDARAFHDFLVYARGVPPDRVQLIEGANRAQILAAVDRAVGDVGSGGTIWVYFAGHGAADPSTGARVILGDAVKSDLVAFTAEAVRLDEIEDRATGEGANVAMVLDTCYTGVGRAGDQLIVGKRFVVPQVKVKLKPKVLRWNAADADEMSGPLEKARHGLFTFFAIGALRGWADGEIDGKPDGEVSWQEAQTYVGRALRTVQERSQKPSLEGDDQSVGWTPVSGELENGPDLEALRRELAGEPSVVVDVQMVKETNPVDIGASSGGAAPVVAGSNASGVPAAAFPVRPLLWGVDGLFLTAGVVSLVRGVVLQGQLKDDVSAGTVDDAAAEVERERINQAYVMGYAGLGIGAAGGVGLWATGRAHDTSAMFGVSGTW